MLNLNKEKIVDILKKLKDPESEQSLYDLQIVIHIDYEEEAKKLIISLDFNRRMPNCIGCKPIAWMVQKKIVEQLENEFFEFKEVKQIDFKYS